MSSKFVVILEGMKRPLTFSSTEAAYRFQEYLLVCIVSLESLFRTAQRGVLALLTLMRAAAKIVGIFTTLTD